MSQIRWVVQLSLGIMFALSTASKLADPMGFIRGVREYRILPQRSVLVFSLLLIVCEGFVSLSHLANWLLVFAAPIGLTMLCVFFAAVSVNLVRKRHLPCFCFGSGQRETTSARSLVRLAIAILGELVLLLQPGFFSGSFAHPAYYASAKDAVIAVSLALFALIATVWVLSLPDLLRLLRGRLHNQNQRISHS